MNTNPADSNASEREPQSSSALDDSTVHQDRDECGCERLDNGECGCLRDRITRDERLA